jgi:hypothetical protein
MEYFLEGGVIVQNPIQLEVLEPRLLLSTVLPVGGVATFDFNGDTTRDAVLQNTGSSAIEYDVVGVNGLAINLQGDGAAFRTNTWVQVADANPLDDFALTLAQVGTATLYNSQLFNAIDGASTVAAGAIGDLLVGRGDLASAVTSESGINRIQLGNGDLYNVNSAGAIGSITVNGDILGSVVAASTIGEIQAHAITGGALIQSAGLGTVQVNTISDAVLQVNGDFQALRAHQLIGTQNGTVVAVTGALGSVYADTFTGGGDGCLLSLNVNGGAGSISAGTITAGTNGLLVITVTGDLDRLSADQIDGGTAVGGGSSQTILAVTGGINVICIGRMIGGTGNGNATLEIDVGTDVQSLVAGSVIGGNMTGGNATLNINIGHDLLYARIGQMIGSGTTPKTCDPVVNLTVGHDIKKLIVGTLSGGTATGAASVSVVNITAGNDVVCLSAGTIDGGTARGDAALAEVRVTAGHDINAIRADQITGGAAYGDGTMAGVYFDAARNINLIDVGTISGTQFDRPRRKVDPTVQFFAGGDIGMLMADQIAGGSVRSGTTAVAVASVVVRADGTYVDGGGVQSLGNIDSIVAGTIFGGRATGDDALAYVKISAAHDINSLCADLISGGRTSEGGYTYVNIFAEHNINKVKVGTIRGSENVGPKCDPAVQIQAYNDLKSFTACNIIGGIGGTVNILAGFNAAGEVSGEVNGQGVFEAGSIEYICLGGVYAAGGLVNIAASGDIGYLKACSIMANSGEVNVYAGRNLKADVGEVSGWVKRDGLRGPVTDAGVEFTAGGTLTDIRHSIRSQYISSSEPAPVPLVLPEA